MLYGGIKGGNMEAKPTQSLLILRRIFAQQNDRFCVCAQTTTNSPIKTQGGTFKYTISFKRSLALPCLAKNNRCDGGVTNEVFKYRISQKIKNQSLCSLAQKPLTRNLVIQGRKEKEWASVPFYGEFVQSFFFVSISFKRG